MGVLASVKNSHCAEANTGLTDNTLEIFTFKAVCLQSYNSESPNKLLMLDKGKVEVSIGK